MGPRWGRIGDDDNNAGHLVAQAIQGLAVRLPCQRPVRRLRVDTGTGEATEVQIRCGTRVASKCPSCADLYRGDASAILREGMAQADREALVVLLTLTAPSFGRTHWVAERAPERGTRAHTKWVRRAGQRRCSCGQRHRPGDDRWRGVPLDPQGYDYRGQVRWNSMVGRLWARTADEIARALAMGGRLQYAAVAEWQRRGAVHLHALLRVPVTAALDLYRDGDGNVRSRTIEGLVASVGTFDGPNRTGSRYAWGTQVDARVVQDPSGRTQARTAGYLAKLITYAAKDLGEDVLGRRLEPQRWHLRLLAASVRRLPCSAHDGEPASVPDGACADCRRLNGSVWGYRGHVLRRSREWSSKTLTSCRQQRAEVMRTPATGTGAKVVWLAPAGHVVGSRHEFDRLKSRARDVLACGPP